MICATGISKVLGLLRSVIMANLYGDTSDAAAFIAASNIPLTFFDFLLGAAILGSFIPVFNSYEKTSEQDEFASVFINAALLVSGLFSLLGMIFSKQLIAFLAPEFAPQTAELASKLLAIMFPAIIFTSIAYSISGILQSKGRFLMPAMMSAISNTGVLIYFFAFNRYFGVTGLAVAYLCSWLIQVITLVVPLVRERFKYSFKIDLKNAGLHKVLKTSLPIMAGSWLIPISTLSALFFSPSGEVYTAFDYANRTYLLIAGILTYGICNYIFPKLSKLSSSGDDEAFNGLVRSGVSTSLYIILPVALTAVVLKDEIISILYLWGNFTVEAAQTTSQGFLFLIGGMLSFTIIEVMSRVFYAKSKVKVPMIAAISAVGVNLLLSALLNRVFSWGIRGLALANIAGQITSSFIMLAAAGIYLKGALNRKFLSDIISYAICGAAAFAAMYAIHTIWTVDAFTPDKLPIILKCAVVFITGVVVYFGLYRICLLSRIFTKFKRKDR